MPCPRSRGGFRRRRADGPRLRDPAAAQRRGDGEGLSREAGGLETTGLRESPLDRRGRRPRPLPDSLQSGGGTPGQRLPSPYPLDLRLRHHERLRPAVPGDRVHRGGRSAPVHDRRSTDAHRPGPVDPPPGRRSVDLPAQPRDPPPRPEAREHPGALGLHGEGGRPRHRGSPGGGRPADPLRIAAWGRSATCHPSSIMP